MQEFFGGFEIATYYKYQGSVRRTDRRYSRSTVKIYMEEFIQKRVKIIKYATQVRTLEFEIARRSE